MCLATQQSEAACVPFAVGAFYPGEGFWAEGFGAGIKTASRLKDLA